MESKTCGMYQTSSSYLVLGVHLPREGYFTTCFSEIDWSAKKCGKANLGQSFQFDRTHTCDRSGFLQVFFLPSSPGEQKDRNPIPHHPPKIKHPQETMVLIGGFQ